MNNSKLKLVIAEDQSIFREGLNALFSSLPQFEIMGSTGDGLEALQLATTHLPDVMIISLALPRMVGTALARRVRQLSPSPEIVFLVSNHSQNIMRQVFESGARAYLLKSCSSDELFEAVKKAAYGEYYLSNPTDYDLLAEYVKPILISQPPGGMITPREREIAHLLADGYSTKEAADVLNISPKTAETHRASLMRKLNARNVTDIVKYCIRNQIIEI